MGREIVNMNNIVRGKYGHRCELEIHEDSNSNNFE
jgi:hypothetical protein